MAGTPAWVRARVEQHLHRGDWRPPAHPQRRVVPRTVQDADRVHGGAGSDDQPGCLDVAVVQGNLEEGPQPSPVGYGAGVSEVRQAEGEKVQVAVAGGLGEMVHGAGSSGGKQELYSSQFEGVGLGVDRVHAHGYGEFDGGGVHEPGRGNVGVSAQSAVWVGAAFERECHGVGPVVADGPE